MQPSFLFKALVTSKLDYCNFLLHGLPKNVIKQLQRLQRVQNAAARVVTLSPVLTNLHWLQIDLRIECKIFTVTYRDSPWNCSCLY